MAIIKVKFRASTMAEHEGVLFYQVTHKRVIRQLKSGCHVRAEEWNGSEICFGKFPDRNRQLNIMAEKIALDMARLGRIVKTLDARQTPYTVDDVVTAFHSPVQQADTVFTFMRQFIAFKRRIGAIRTAETYEATLRSFTRFRGGYDMPLSSFDAEMASCYEAYLKSEGLCRNTSSFYMRRMRAVYNRAADKGLILSGNPFRHVYTGIDKTLKRAVDLSTLRRIKEMNLSRSPALDFARDMFLFCFYTRGMPFIDMAYLKKTDIKGNILSYRRHKTGQQIFIRWEKCMRLIADKYTSVGSTYLLPIIIKPGKDERRQYSNKSHYINSNLKKIGKLAGVEMPLTMYVARHTWASIAKSKNIPLSIISESMGHASETTTRIYLASLDTGVLDKANKVIINSIK